MEESIVDWGFKLISKELKKEEFKENVLKPLVKSLIFYIMPYLFFVIAINIFLVILAFILVIKIYPYSIKQWWKNKIKVVLST